MAEGSRTKSTLMAIAIMLFAAAFLIFAQSNVLSRKTELFFNAESRQPTPARDPANASNPVTAASEDPVAIPEGPATRNTTESGEHHATSSPNTLISDTPVTPVVRTVEILALDVGVNDWDWIDISPCEHLGCRVTPCCVNERFVCTQEDLDRSNASTLHLEWYGVKRDGKKCGRECCQRWGELGFDDRSRMLIGVQNEKDNWGRNTDPSVLSSLDYFLTFKPADSVVLPPDARTRNNKPTIVQQYVFAEPAWAFNAAILSKPRGAANEPPVKKWADLAPGPSSPFAISFIQNECKPLHTELVKRGLPIDSYGACQHNRDPGFAMQSWTRTMYEQKIAILSRHVFDLAIENDINAPGWNTERVFHALLVHTIPIYAGHASVLSMIPHRDSIIFAGDFDNNWDKLADYIRSVSSSPDLRAKHLHWTTLPPSQWDNGFPHAQYDSSRLSGAMCKVCKELLAAAAPPK